MDIRRGIIRAFNSGTYLADVQIVGSMATMLTGVPVAKQIGVDLLMSGTKCGVLFFDETNPSDACVVFVYEGAPAAWVTSALIKDGEIVEVDLAFDPAIVDSAETISADWLFSGEYKVQFRDGQIYVHSAADGYLDLVADVAVRIGSAAGAARLELGADCAIYRAAVDKLKTDDQFLYEGFGARVYRSTNQSIPNATWTDISFDTERFDTDGIWDAANPTRLTCQTAGKYQITGQIRFDANDVGMRGIRIRLNGGADIANYLDALASGGWYRQATTLWDLSVGDYLELSVRQTSGGALNVVATPNFSPEFMMVRVG